MSEIDDKAFDMLGDALNEGVGAPIEEKEEVATTEDDAPVDDTSTEDDAPAEDESSEEEDTEDDGEEQAPAEEKETVQEYLSKEDIKAAFREMQQEQNESRDFRSSLRDEIREKMYPEGLENPIRDSANNIITGVKDMVGKLIDPETGDPFTREGAQEWWEAVTSEDNKRIESVEQDIDKIAETNQTLAQEAQVVQAKYGDFLARNPEVAQKVLNSWNSTLRKDEKTGIVVDAPVSLAGYYDTVLEPYVQMAQAQSVREQSDRKSVV